MKTRKYWLPCLSSLLPIVLGSSFAHAASAEEDPGFSEFSFEELLDVVVTTVSKKEQKIGDAAAAIFVISQDDIRRSGATNVADALRMVPGILVARVNSHAWAVSVRGFNDYFASKLLVLVDGRSVYTPEFSGVYWDTVTPPLDDIERIEVIRGPGGTLWGANAVNGVINIITKKAKATQGTLVVAGGGNEEQAFARARHGGQLNEKTAYRVYGTYNKRDDSQGSKADGWDVGQAGFRIDSAPSEKTNWTVQGDAYKNKQDEIHWQTQQPGEGDIVGANLLTRWERNFSEASDMTVQAYYDYYDRDLPTVDIRNHTFDLDFQHRYALNDTHELLWGGGYRRIENNIPEQPSLNFNPSKRGNNLWSAFLQDEIKLVPDKLILTLGSKFEHNDYTGFELQPNVRFMWTPADKISVWGAASRAVRTPSRADHDVSIEVTVPPALNPTPLPNMVVRGLGNKAVDSETVVAYEFGVRRQSSPRFSWDAVVFLHRYDKIMVSNETNFAELDKGLFVLQSQPFNAAKGDGYGLELVANWTPKDWWRLQGSYTFLKLDMDIYQDINTSAHINLEGKVPEHQLSLRSSMDLNKDWSLDLWLRHVAELAVGVDSYTTLDARLAWSVSKQVELSVVGQNLLEDNHVEYLPAGFNPLGGALERGIYAQVRWELD